MGTSRQLVLFVCLLLAARVSCNLKSTAPIHVWPISNISMFNDVMGHVTITHDKASVCFNFKEGPLDLPYSVLDLQHQSDHCYDVYFKNAEPFRDLTFSLFVYADNDVEDIKGTMIHYQAQDREILRIRMLANTLLVSFRDEYGMSAGMMYLVNFLNPRVWNHVIITRDYVTGRIVVNKDGVEMYNDDDEFSDVISFPSAGKLRMGKSQDPDDEDVFNGEIACVQVYDYVVPADGSDMVKDFCQPNNWKNTFKYFYQSRAGQMCVTDPPSNSTSSFVVTMTTLTSGASWGKFLEMSHLNESDNEAGYLRLKSRDMKPSTDRALIGRFNATNQQVCARLCMRVDGCSAILTDKSGVQCDLYHDNSDLFVDSLGAKFYILMD
ncbi:uncharacterized protein LOC127845161 [Dreissena polymorpha]|uniref:Uncharacterized protein n=1 Tax=Dreissena polymorpha TaxID=45954 RepID=A0A9D4IG11_DREPO|nr:uncharacterized protein LOC127845161 [Dreissena polymorpha]XP_052231879.1 uncharacterized protein LOC127845161 [Dreissena polymorpha]KAH3772039.1 hypothetical protein DPMN_173371 [Dreissena polymorpha]